MTFDLDPFESCGPLSRGLPFERVKGLLGPEARAFRKSPMSRYETLDASGRFHVFFDENGTCEGVEFFADHIQPVTFAGETLLTPDGAAFVETLIRLGQHWEVDTYGIHAPMLGLATYHHAFDWDAGEKQIGALYVSLDPGFVP